MNIDCLPILVHVKYNTFTVLKNIIKMQLCIWLDKGVIYLKNCPTLKMFPLILWDMLTSRLFPLYRTRSAESGMLHPHFLTLLSISSVSDCSSAESCMRDRWAWSSKLVLTCGSLYFWLDNLLGRRLASYSSKSKQNWYHE